MSKLLTVVGATGTQGLSVIDALLKDKSYKIRGLTRNPQSENAKRLASRGVEVVKADLNDEQSLVKAFEGSNAIYAITDFFEPFGSSGPEEAIKVEVAQGINLARAASKTPTLKHYIWSTLPNGAKISNGKYRIPHFEGKNQIDDYIRQDANLLAKTTFFWITFYANNFQYPVFIPNLLKSSGAYVQLSTAAADVPIKTIGSTRANAGIFVRAILQQPQLTLGGKFVIGSVEETTTGDLLKAWGEATGKPTRYVQTSLDDFSALWPGWGLEMGEMMKMWDEVRERSWSGEEGLLTKEDLGIQNENFVYAKAAFEELDWTSL